MVLLGKPDRGIKFPIGPCSMFSNISVCISEMCVHVLASLRYLGSPGDLPWECVFSSLCLESGISSVACAFQAFQSILNLSH